jgi:RNA polymerase sigma-70 factor (ECF subfamily)
MESAPISEQLMAEMGWVRRLARALVNDDAIADDVAQDAWLVAAEQRPSEDRPLRPWLARVVQNLARTRRRGEVRRGVREATVEDSRSVPTPVELVERVELQRAVAGEVLELAEPYRSTVLLRFVEGLSSAEIARRLELPDSTVRRRLKIAIDQLRERLEARDDKPRHGWLAGLVPLARLPVPQRAVPTALGALAMKKLIAGVALLILLLAIGGVVWWKHGDRGAGSSEGSAGGGGTSGGRLSNAGGELQQLASVPAWTSQRGVVSRRVAGHVVFAGAPVANAKVRLGLAVDLAVMQPIAELRSGPDGAFDFGLQPAAVFTVSADAPERAPVSLSIALADPRAKADQLELVLGDCRSRLYGMVLDASGGGVAKARLFAAGLSGAETDATGQYSLCIRAEQSQIRVEADGYGTIAAPIRLYGELHYDFVLVPEAILVGQVVGTDQKPVAAARVIARPDPGEGPHHVAGMWATADADGRFRITGLAPGKFQLTATADALGSSTPLIAIARPGASSHDLRIMIANLGRVRGHVVMDGKPVVGAGVSAVKPGQPPSAPSFSQADGSFVLDGVPLGPTAFVAPPYDVKTPKTFSIASEGNVTLEVSKLATLRGRVTRHGKPVAGADVFCAGRTVAKSDASGAYLLEGLSPGPTQCGAWDVDGRAGTIDKPLTIAAGEDKTFDIELDCSGEVKGIVVDESDKPVAGVYVLMDNGEGDRGESMTDKTGAFDCTSMTGGKYIVAVYPSPMAGRAFRPATGDQLDPIDVPRDAAVTGIKLAIKYEQLAIRGKVSDDTGAQVPDVHVEAIGRGRGGIDLPSVMSDATGHFEIKNLASGTYSLHAHAADGSETEVLNIAAGANDVSIKLARPGAIDGKLVGFSSPPVVEANTLTPNLRLGGQAIVDGDSFSATGLPPGRYTIQAKNGAEVDGQSVDVRSGETTHVTLRSRGLGKLEGRITEYGSKAPVAGFRCDGNLSMGGQMGGSPPDPSLQAFTDANGHFTLSAPIGRVRVLCGPQSPTLLTAAGTDVEVTNTGMAHVELVSVRSTFGTSPGDPGFRVTPLTLPLTVNLIDPTGPAAASGLVAGDHLVTIDGATLQGILPIGAAVLLLNHKPGTTITLGIERNGVAMTFKVVTVARHD